MGSHIEAILLQKKMKPPTQLEGPMKPLELEVKKVDEVIHQIKRLWRLLQSSHSKPLRIYTAADITGKKY